MGSHYLLSTFCTSVTYIQTYLIHKLYLMEIKYEFFYIAQNRTGYYRKRRQ